MSEDLPLVSIIIVTFNSEQHIDSCLLSLEKTTYPQFEIIIIDNHSTDGTKNIISTYISRHTVITNDQNYGFAGGINQGVAVSKGEVIVFLNPDCIVTPDWLHHLVAPLRYECVGATGSTLLYPNDNTIQSVGGKINKLGFTRHYQYGEQYGLQLQNINVDYVTGAVLATKKILYENIGGLDEKYFPVYFEETDYCTLLRDAGYHVLYIPASVVHHAESQSVSLFSENYFYWYHSGRLRFMLKRQFSLIEMISLFFQEIVWFIYYHAGGAIKAVLKLDRNGLTRKWFSFKAMIRAYSETIRNRKEIVIARENRARLLDTLATPHSL